MRIGVDVGGTNTDIMLIENGKFRLHKIPSTTNQPEKAVIQGTKELGISLQDVEEYAHGTTVVTNSIIQRKGAPTGLITTKGFRDVLQIRRTTRGKLYDFQWDPPQELVLRNWRREISERTNSRGQVTLPPDLDEALAQASALVADGIQSLAICFINAYLNGENERAVRDAITKKFPELPVYLSSDILPEWREFERTSTTAVSAYSGPILTRYIRTLEQELKTMGYSYDLLLMLSSGGLVAADEAIALPGLTLESGPAAGVLAQKVIGDAAGYQNIIGMDIGGTSTDISLIHQGEPYLKNEVDIEFGTVVAYPMIDINSIGAGGSTIIWVDKGGLLHLGPQSAGSVPGPACQEQGGVDPTITDANVVLHRLNPAYLLGGRVKISEKTARKVIEEVGQKIGLDTERTAKGIIDLTVAKIASAIRQHTIERGLDPREFVLVAYGGAGPVFSIDVAAEVGIKSVLIPPSPGGTSALGLLLTDIRHDFVSTFLRDAHNVTPQEVNSVYEGFKQVGRAKLENEGIPADRVAYVYSMDLRYAGQTHDLSITLPATTYDESVHEQLATLLHEKHLREFGHAPESNEPIEIVNLRLACLGLIDRPTLPEIPAGPQAAPAEYRQVYMLDRWLETPVFNRSDLYQGNSVQGPAIVEQLDSTTVILPGWVGTVDRFGNIILQPETIS